MITKDHLTAEMQKHWDSMLNQLNDYRNANHGDYPDNSLGERKLYNWVASQRKEFGPCVDGNGNLKPNVEINALKKQRIALLKKIGFVFDHYKDASVNQAVIKFSIIDRLFVKEYSTMGEAARQNNMTNKYGVSQWLAAWMDPTEKGERRRSLACHNMIFRSKDSLPPYSSEYQYLDKKIKQKVKKTDPMYKSFMIYSETNGKINHDDEVFKKADFLKRFKKELKDQRWLTHAAPNIGPISHKGRTIYVNPRIHDALKGKGIEIDDKTYKYCEPQFIPNYFCFRDD